MLARVAGVVRHRALRMVATLVILAYPVWANPTRVNADPNGWSPKFSLTFESQADFDAVCRSSGTVALSNGYLSIGARSGIECPGSKQDWGKYEFDAVAAAGSTATFELRSPGRAPSSLQLLTRNGVEVMRLVNGDDGRLQDWPFTFSDKIHRYGIELAPFGLAVFVDECERLHDAKVTAATRTLAMSTDNGGLRVNTLHVSSYGGGIADDVASGCGQTSSPVTPAQQGRNQGRGWWWIGGAVALAVAVTLAVVAVRRRDPRKLRPGHRK
jgi:hypothetical protein